MQDAAQELFLRVRPRLMGIGYRMLSSVQEAEDLVQDAWLRWHEEKSHSETEIINAEAWLVAMTTRMAIDRLRAAKVRRTHYPGLWLPEPLLTEGPIRPDQARELSEDVSIAFLILLDCLSPEARAAFLLREVFEMDYDQIATAIGKNESATRQIVHRAKTRLNKARSSYGRSSQTPPPEEQLDLLRRLVQAISQGEFSTIQALIAEEAEFLSDFGSITPRLSKALFGGRRIAQLYFASYLRHGSSMRFEIVPFNGRWALMRYLNEKLDSVQTFEFELGQITQILLQRNPDKLAHLKR